MSCKKEPLWQWATAFYETSQIPIADSYLRAKTALFIFASLRSQGVNDVVVIDPYALVVLHVRRDGVTRQVSPLEILLECGCQCVV